MKRWKTDSGVVVDYVKRHYGYQLNYAPKIEFTTDDGKQITFVTSSGSNRMGYRIGDKVKVVYSPDDPEKADLKSFSNLWIFPIVLAIFASVFGGVGLFIFIHCCLEVLK